MLELITKLFFLQAPQIYPWVVRVCNLMAQIKPIFNLKFELTLNVYYAILLFN